MSDKRRVKHTVIDGGNYMNICAKKYNRSGVNNTAVWRQRRKAIHGGVENFCDAKQTN